MDFGGNAVTVRCAVLQQNCGNCVNELRVQAKLEPGDWLNVWEAKDLLTGRNEIRMDPCPTSAPSMAPSAAPPSAPSGSPSPSANPSSNPIVLYQVRLMVSEDYANVTFEVIVETLKDKILFVDEAIPVDRLQSDRILFTKYDARLTC
jgi:hypothetical protein